ncbi:MAG: 3-dehydroquinate synthase, partial [Acidobacteriia bacterium]|nr:3-dehydroquinate synthase [Terriglobia bacterium]
GPIPPLAGVSADNLAARLLHDKTTVRGEIHLVLPVRMGEVTIASGIDPRLVGEAIRSALA